MKRIAFTVLVLLACSPAVLPATSSAAPALHGTAEPKGGTAAPLPLKPERRIDYTTTEGTWVSLDVSPDGHTIVFDLVGDLYSIPIAGGEARKLTGGMGFSGQPAYSPDGRKIAFTSDRGGAENVWICDADGSNPLQLSQDEQSEFASPAWTPDGQYVVATRTTPPAATQSPPPVATPNSSS